MAVVPGRVRTQARDAEALPLRGVDIIVTSMATFGAAYLVLAGRWVPGWLPAFLTLSVIAIGPPLFRYLAQRHPKVRAFDLIASFWLLPSVIVAHFCMEPLIDAVHPRLLDGTLAAIDLRLFGAHPAKVLGDAVGPVITEVLLVCYYSYFVGPFILALLLFFRGMRAQYEQYAFALGLYFAANFVFYTLVPAVGPRYFLAEIFDAPLQGVWLTSYLDGLMRTTLFARDCFPSGHTGVTLVMLSFAWRFQRRFFWMILPVGVGLIIATLVGRFHYGIDLIFAVPVVVAAVSLSALVFKVAPEGRLFSARTLRELRRLSRA